MISRPFWDTLSSVRESRLLFFYLASSLALPVVVRVPRSLLLQHDKGFGKRYVLFSLCMCHTDSCTRIMICYGLSDANFRLHSVLLRMASLSRKKQALRILDLWEDWTSIHAYLGFLCHLRLHSCLWSIESCLTTVLLFRLPNLRPLIHPYEQPSVEVVRGLVGVVTSHRRYFGLC